MRWHGYRPDRQRFIVFQALQHTLKLLPEQWRVLDKAHSNRNLAEYEGYAEVDEQLLAELVKITEIMRDKVAVLGPVRKSAIPPSSVRPPPRSCGSITPPRFRNRRRC